MQNKEGTSRRDLLKKMAIGSSAGVLGLFGGGNLLNGRLKNRYGRKNPLAF